MRILACGLALGLWLSCSTRAEAADGDKLWTDRTLKGGTSNAWLLCDSKAAAAAGGVCVTAGVSTGMYGSLTSFVISHKTTCSAFSIALLGKQAAGDDFTIIATLTQAGASYYAAAMPFTIFSVTLTTLTSCTDFDVVLEVFQGRDSKL